MKKVVFFIGVISLCALISTSVQAGYLFVPSQYANIQSAIDSPFCDDSDVVIVGNGTYVENTGFRDIDFRGKSITVRSAEGPDKCTIVCGNGHRGFYFHSAEDSNSILDGFTIMTGSVAGYGGAILCEPNSPTEPSNPTIKNCIIKNSSAEYGGGIAIRSSSPTILNCTIKDNGKISGNECSQGGGIYLESASPIINNCKIQYNQADNGAGIYCTSTSSPTITNATEITGNNAVYGGGIYSDSSTVTIEANSVLTGNFAQGSEEAFGGGIYCQLSSLNISASTISENFSQSDYSSFGGGIYVGYGSANIANSSINNNQATCVYDLSLGGGIHCEVTNLHITDSNISDNSADYGGGIFCYDSNSILITKSHINGNKTTYGDGGGIYMEKDCTGEISSCVITGNSANGCGGGIECITRSSPKIKSCVISGNTTLTYTGGAIDCFGSSPKIINCTISSNETFNDVGGGVNCETDTGTIPWIASRPIIKNCIFENNSYYGIYEYSQESDPNVEYCLFYNNNPDEHGTYGDYWDYDTYMSYTALSGDNCINDITDGHANNNTAGNPLFAVTDSGTWSTGPNEPYYNSGTDRTILTDNTASFAMSELIGKYMNPNTNQRRQIKIVNNTASTIEVTGDITNYVAGADTYKLIDYHIQSGSPCINAGDPNYTGEDGEIDIDQEERVFNNRVDIGADEMGFDFSRLAGFSDHWLDTGCSAINNWCNGADASNDGNVNFIDFAMLDLF